MSSSGENRFSLSKYASRGHPQSQEARIVEIEDRAVTTPGLRERGGKRPPADLGDAPVAVVGERHREVFFELRKRANILDANDRPHGFDIGRRVQNHPVLLLGGNEENRRVVAVESFDVSQEDEVVILAVGHLKLEPPRLGSFGGEHEHRSVGNGVEHACPPTREDAPNLVRIRVVEIEPRRQFRISGVVVLCRRCRLLRLDAHGDEQAPAKDKGDGEGFDEYRSFMMASSLEQRLYLH